VKMTFKLAQMLDATPRSGDGIATLALTALVRDADGHVFPKFVIETLSSDEAAGRGSRSEIREFAFTMEPGRSYQVLLSGQTTVTTEPDTTASARLEIQDLEMTIDFTAAPDETPTATAAGQ